MSEEARNVPYVPATDIVEMEDGVHIFMDLPGVSVENLSIDLEENELVIKGVSTYLKPEEDKERILHSEFTGLEYQRTFTLSDMVDREQIKANLVDGVLNLFLPRAEAMKPRKIEIS